MKNPEFLKNKYKDLAASEEVKRAADRERARRSKRWKGLRDARDFEAAKRVKKLGNDPEDLIQTYLDRISRVLDAPQKNLDEKRKEQRRQKVLHLFKKAIYERFVIKPEEIPKSHFDHQREEARNLGHGDVEITDEMRKQAAEIILTDQKRRIDNWLEYMSSKDAMYPDWLKYFALRSVLGMGEYDKEKKQFSVRSKGTTKPIPDLNREALAYVLDALNKKYQDTGKKESRFEQQEKQLQWEELLQNEHFGSLYAFAIQEVTPAEKSELARTEGKWVVYLMNADHMPLVRSLQGCGTGWCTAGEETAKQQMETGDFHVYYSYAPESFDEDGTIKKGSKPRNPRIGIRMKGSGKDARIEEIRGVFPEQNLDPFIAPVVQEKLRTFGEEGKKYEKRASDMKKLTDIDKKMKKGEILTPQELRFLYEVDSPIEGFGYQKDPRIKELIDQRDKKADAPLVLECSQEQIAWRKEDLRPDTKAYIGPLFDGFFTKIPKSLLHVYTSFPEGKIHQVTVPIDARKSWEQKVEAGHYDYVDSDFELWVNQKEITSQKEKKNTTHDLVLITFPRSVPTAEAEKEISRLDLEKATVEDLLAVGAQCPDLQRKHYIVSLGSSAPYGDGHTVVPVLYGLGDRRSLDFLYYGLQWLGNYRFLARRK